MNVSFNQLDDTQKSVHFLSGTYPIEYDKNISWIWTTDYVYGTVSNVNSIVFKAFSEIENSLTCDNITIDIKPNCLNIIKINTKGKTDFSLQLKNIYNTSGDSRNLGLKLIGINVDGEFIF